MKICQLNNKMLASDGYHLLMDLKNTSLLNLSEIFPTVLVTSCTISVVLFFK